MKYFNVQLGYNKSSYTIQIYNTKISHQKMHLLPLWHDFPFLPSKNPALQEHIKPYPFFSQITAQPPLLFLSQGWTNEKVKYRYIKSFTLYSYTFVYSTTTKLQNHGNTILRKRQCMIKNHEDEFLVGIIWK